MPSCSAPIVAVPTIINDQKFTLRAEERRSAAKEFAGLPQRLWSSLSKTPFRLESSSININLVDSKLLKHHGTLAKDFCSKLNRFEMRWKNIICHVQWRISCECPDKAEHAGEFRRALYGEDGNFVTADDVKTALLHVPCHLLQLMFKQSKVLCPWIKYQLR